MKRVFLYVRVSTEEQALHGLSIEAQTVALKDWAKKEHHQVVGVYTDAGISARKPASKRTALQTLLDDVRAGKGDLVVFTKLDRWFRNISEYYKVQEVLEKHHVDWKTIHEDYDTSNASGRLKINIMLSVAQDEADRTSERIKSVFEEKRRKVEPLTGSCPTGYKQENKKYIKDPETENAVNAFFRTYLQSGSISAAQKEAEALGLWITNQVAYSMLTSTCYYGRYYDVDGMTPPYITKAEYDKIQASRKRFVRKAKRGWVYIFSGLISCGECGHRMGARANRNGASFSYFCNAHATKANRCKNATNITEKKIEDYLISIIDDQLKSLRIQLQSEATPQKNRDYQSEFSAIKKKIKRLKDLYLNELISLDDYKADFETYSRDLASLESESRKNRSPDLSIIERTLCADWKLLYMQSDKEAKQRFWRAITKEIRIYKDRHIEFDFNI